MPAPGRPAKRLPSRLGHQQWLTPYTEHVLAELPNKGVKRLAITCPAFVADNLATLEKMGITGRERLLAAGDFGPPRVVTS